jgi:broad specificity polyphosphatase/5'/3'-nucleotidase SurE
LAKLRTPKSHYEPLATERKTLSDPGLISYREAGRLEDEPEDTDVYALRKKRIVSVSPLSLDMSSRVELAELEKKMRT